MEFFSEMAGEFFLWIKALHIVAVISWMAGLLYLPRLFVYHCRSTLTEQSATFAIMEDRLLKVIMRPAMIATWGLGIILAAIPGVVSWSSDWWFYAKVLLVVALTGFHERLAKHVKAFASDNNSHSEKYFRLINEVPTVLMIVIVVLVVVKPF